MNKESIRCKISYNCQGLRKGISISGPPQLTPHEARCRMHVALDEHADIVPFSRRNILLLCLPSKEGFEIQGSVLSDVLYPIQSRSCDPLLEVMIETP